MKYLLCFLCIVIMGSSCKKSFLDVTDGNQLNRQTYVKDLETMEEFLNGIYVMMAVRYESANSSLYAELVADNITPLASPPQVMMPHYTWSQQAVNGEDGQTVSSNSLSSNGIWAQSYSVIRACDFVIEDIGKYRGENPAKADEMKGAAYAMRAIMHFRLINVFAQPYAYSANATHIGVPYITASDVSAHYTRQTVAEVYDKIIDDYKKALQLLPATVTDLRYVNRMAVKALLARTYLFKNDYAEAKTLALGIAGQVPLLSIANGYPIDLYKFKSPSQTESLFLLTPDRTSYSTSFPGVSFKLYINFYATNDIASLLKENSTDVRAAWVTNSSGVWSVQKFPSGVAPNITPVEYAYYAPVIRSSEMFLTISEAAAKTNDENTARAYLDSIRKRANPAIAPVTATGPALLDSIYKERRKELCFEGLRMFDLQRWKLGVHRTDALSGAPKDLSYPNSKAIAPIPLSEVYLMGLSQNTDY